MVLSGIENTLIIALVIWVVISQPLLLLKSIKGDAFLIFCVLFTIILGFGVGLSTSNFGALVRYKIPFLPFFTFLILYNIKWLNNGEDLRKPIDSKKNKESFKDRGEEQENKDDEKFELMTFSQKFS